MDDGHGWTLEHLRTRLRFLMKCLGCLWALQFHVAGISLLTLTLTTRPHFGQNTSKEGFQADISKMLPEN